MRCGDDATIVDERVTFKKCFKILFCLHFSSCRLCEKGHFFFHKSLTFEDIEPNARKNILIEGPDKSLSFDYFTTCSIHKECTFFNQTNIAHVYKMMCIFCIWSVNSNNV